MSILKICKQANPIFNGRFHVPQINKRMGRGAILKGRSIKHKNLQKRNTRYNSYIIVELYLIY